MESENREENTPEEKYLGEESFINTNNHFGISLLVTGDKGLNLLKDLPEQIHIFEVVNYEQRLSSATAEQFAHEASRRGADFISAKRPAVSDLRGQLIFAIGWQYMIPNPPENLVVVHDSLLPLFRGFSPTATALLVGAEKIGVSALRPTSDVDAGDILAHSAVSIDDPISISEAFELLRPCYVSAVTEVWGQYLQCSLLSGTPQNEGLATYSLWRDLYDFAIDWECSALEVQRHILASSAPYSGAVCSTFEGGLYKVESAKATEDINLAIRQPGKVWRRSPDSLHVICGEGSVEVPVPLPLDTHSTPLSGLRIRFAPLLATQQRLASKLS